jgi:hypothetical protein
LKQSLDEQTWHQPLAILMEKGLIDMYGLYLVKDLCCDLPAKDAAQYEPAALSVLGMLKFLRAMCSHR